MSWTSLQVMTALNAAAGVCLLAVGVILVIRDASRRATRTDALADLVRWLGDPGSVAVLKGMGDGMTNLATALVRQIEHETGAPVGHGPGGAGGPPRPRGSAAPGQPTVAPHGAVEDVAAAVAGVAEALPKLSPGAQLSLIGAILLAIAAALSAVGHFG